MIELKGKYTRAVIKTDDIEPEAIDQVQAMCDREEFKNANIVIMPDVHAGAGCTVGTTIHMTERKVDPRIVGVDICCGVYTVMFKKDNLNFQELETIIRENVPSGRNIREIPSHYVTADILVKIKDLAEEIGRSGRAQYYVNSLGTLGGGNHYIEVGRVEDTYYLSIHTGSRKLGGDVCEFFTPSMEDRKEALHEAKNKLIADYLAAGRATEIQGALQELTANFEFIPAMYIEGDRFDRYLAAMQTCYEYATLNREIIALEILSKLGVKEYEAFQTMHNYIEILSQNEFIIRKGAIAAYDGVRVAIPLNMRDGVIIGKGKGNADWNYSAPHGAGRAMSRREARNEITLEEFIKTMEGIQTWSVDPSTIDEAPMAYKPAEEIIELVKETVDIDYIVKPLYNFKATEDLDF